MREAAVQLLDAVTVDNGRCSATSDLSHFWSKSLTISTDSGCAKLRASSVAFGNSIHMAAMQADRQLDR